MVSLSKRVITEIQDAIERERASRLMYLAFAEQIVGPCSLALAEHYQDHAGDEEEHEKSWLQLLNLIDVDATTKTGDILEAKGNDEIFAAVREAEQENFDKYQRLYGMALEDDAFVVVAYLGPILQAEAHHLADAQSVVASDDAEEADDVRT